MTPPCLCDEAQGQELDARLAAFKASCAPQCRWLWTCALASRSLTVHLESGNASALPGLLREGGDELCRGPELRGAGTPIHSIPITWVMRPHRTSGDGGGRGSCCPVLPRPGGPRVQALEPPAQSGLD